MVKARKTLACISLLASISCYIIFISIGAPAFAAGDDVKESKVRESGDVWITVTESSVKPQTLTVNPGTTVVWVNRAQNPVRVKFTNNAVSATCEAPRGFLLSRAGFFGSRELTTGDFASLCFLQPNDYRFEIEFMGEMLGSKESVISDSKPLTVSGTVKVQSQS